MYLSCQTANLVSVSFLSAKKAGLFSNLPLMHTLEGLTCASIYKIYVTKFDDNYHPRNTTHSFPIQLFKNMKCVETSDKMYEMCERPHIDNQPKSFLQDYLRQSLFLQVY